MVFFFLKVSVNQVELSVTDNEREPVRDYDSEQHSNEVNQLDSEPDIFYYYFHDNDSLRIQTDEEDFVEEKTVILGNQQNESGKSDTFLISGNFITYTTDSIY